MTVIRKTKNNMEMGEKKASEYAMALDLLAKLAHSGTENEAIEKILELCKILFSPKKLSYVSLSDDNRGQVYSASLSEEDDTTIQNRLANFSKAYAWSVSGNGFILKIEHKGCSLGILEVDDILFPKYREHYLNLALSIVDVCGLTIENARKYQQIKNNEDRLRQEKEKLEDALAKVKQLSGLLPICSYCQKIRDSKGYWNQIETYIKEHSEADFSHSICEACAKEKFPGMNLYDD